ncbi:MAG: hypothetical protein M1823_003232, partial [Watsoniomyces obsoletus]
MKFSGLQRDVLSLYRQCLREAHKKPERSRVHFEQFARSEFHKAGQLDKRDFAAIEYLLRKGRKQLELFSSPAITD